MALRVFSMMTRSVKETHRNVKRRYKKVNAKIGDSNTVTISAVVPYNTR